MSRAIRRQQASAPKEANAVKPLGVRTPRQSRGAKAPTPQQKKRFRLAAPRWSEDIFSELKKVTWPTREETVYLTTVVVIVAVVAGTVLGGIDIFFNWLIDHLLLR